MIEVPITISIEQVRLYNGNILKFPTLYKTSLKGADMEWTMYLDLTGKTVEYYTIHGHCEGKLQKSTPTIVEPKITKTDLIELAMTTIRNDFKNQLIVKGKTYIRGFDPNSVIRGQPMLANKYKDTMKLNYPVFVQRKYDGSRCLVSYQDGELIFLSRQNKEYKFMESHFGKELARLLSLLPDGTELDGEFYAPGKTLAQIISIVRRSINIHTDLEDMQYYIFDINLPGLPQEERQEILQNAKQIYLETYSEPKNFYIIDTFIVKNKRELTRKTEDFISEGYEGIIIRKIHQYNGKEINPIKDTVYVHGRRNNLLKWTPWQRDEGDILEVKDGIGKNKGLAKFVLTNIHYDPNIPKSKPTFTVVPHGTNDDLREIFNHPEEYIGKSYTYEYKSLSEYMVPLKPKGISLRDQEDF